MVYDRKTGTAKSISEMLDSNVDEFTFTSDSKWVYLGAEARGRGAVYSLSVNGGPLKKVLSEGVNGDINVSSDGKTLVFAHNSMTRPNEIFTSSTDGSGVM